MELESKQADLDEIVNTLDNLIDSITYRDYIDILSDIKYKAQDELDEVEDQLYKIRKTEIKEQEKEYWNTQF